MKENLQEKFMEKEVDYDNFEFYDDVDLEEVAAGVKVGNVYVDVA
ncbi:hypothetical protein [Fenollaria timonensis]|nr:hypothetical protein [Fenollaria timonensis]